MLASRARMDQARSSGGKRADGPARALGVRGLRARARRMALRFESPFRRAVEDPNVPLSLDLEQDSDTLLIAFGGMRGLLGVPTWEFFKATGGMPVKRLFVRDLRQCWYHRGIPGYGEDLESSAAALLEVARSGGTERIITAGNSAGGYAALLFGALLGADTVLCFAPQTVIDPVVLAGWDDHRWDEQLNDLRGRGRLDERWQDLAEVLPGMQPLPGAATGTGSLQLYYDSAYEPDRLHAEHIAAVPGVRLIPSEGGRHSVALEMRKSGELDRVLRAALAGGGAPAGGAAPGA